MEVKLGSAGVASSPQTENEIWQPHPGSCQEKPAGVQTLLGCPGSQSRAVGLEGQSALGGTNGDISFRLSSCYTTTTRPSSTGSSWASWQGSRWSPGAWGRLCRACVSTHPSSGCGEARVSGALPLAGEARAFLAPLRGSGSAAQQLMQDRLPRPRIGTGDL